MSNIFERASRISLRFQAPNGVFGTEQLWDLKLTTLDGMAKDLRRKLREAEDESLLDTKSQDLSDVQLSYDIIAHIVKVRLEEAKEKEQAQANAEVRRRAQEILARRKDEALEQLPEAELLKLAGQ